MRIYNIFIIYVILIIKIFAYENGAFNGVAETERNNAGINKKVSLPIDIFLNVFS